MDNLLMGLRAVLMELKDTLGRLTDYPLFWGFVIGFGTSTIVHAFLLVDSPRQVSAVLLKDKAESFQKLYPPKADGSFTKSYADYSRMADRVKITFLSTALFGMAVLLIVVITR